MNWLALPASAAWKLDAGTVQCPTAEVSDRTSLSSDDINLVQDMSRGCLFTKLNSLLDMIVSLVSRWDLKIAACTSNLCHKRELLLSLSQCES